MTLKSKEEQIKELLQSFPALGTRLTESAVSLNALLVQEPDSSIEGASHRYWELLAISNVVSKARVLLNELTVIETVSLLALTRYLFELVVWLKYLQLDARYGVVLAHESFRLQLEHFSKLAEHLRREADLYRRLGAEESRAHEEAIRRMRDGSIEGAEIGDSLRALSADVDRELANNFALFANDVQWNGYGFQTYLIETKALRSNLEEENKARTTLARFEARWSDVISGLRMANKWAKRAETVRMSDEYDFIYSYTSRLLHATPASFLTEEKSLSALEFVTLLRYVQIQLVWIISFAGARAAGQR